jgi:hypothetical protein
VRPWPFPYPKQNGSWVGHVFHVFTFTRSKYDNHFWRTRCPVGLWISHKTCGTNRSFASEECKVHITRYHYSKSSNLSKFVPTCCTMSAYSFRILHDRKQTTVLFCIAVCDTYAVGVKPYYQPILHSFKFVFFIFKFKATLAELMSWKLKVSSAFSSSSQHQIMSTLQVMVNFIRFKGHTWIGPYRTHLYRTSKRWSVQRRGRVYKAINRPLWPPGWSTLKSSLQIIVEFLTFEHSIRALAFRRSGLSVRRQMEESVIPRTPLLRKHWCSTTNIMIMTCRINLNSRSCSAVYYFLLDIQCKMATVAKKRRRPKQLQQRKWPQPRRWLRPKAC